MTAEEHPAEADLDTVRAGLAAYNREQAGDDDLQPLTLLVRDADGAVIGGLLGATYWGWLVIEILWLAPSIRQRGVGSRLLAMAEDTHHP